MLSFPFSYHIFPELGRLFASYFEGIIRFIGDFVLNIEKPYTKAILSDSTGLYIHSLFLLIVSFVIAGIWSIFNKKTCRRLRLFFHSGISYYLALQLLIYGFNKIFKHCSFLQGSLVNMLIGFQ